MTGPAFNSPTMFPKATILLVVVFVMSCTATTQRKISSSGFIADTIKNDTSSVTQKKLKELDSIDRTNSGAIAMDAENIQKVTISRSDSSIWLTENRNRDYRIFGYDKPDTSSRKMILISIFADEVTQNPFQCLFGAYFDTRDFVDIKLKFVSIEGLFIKANIMKNDVIERSIYIEKKFVRFDLNIGDLAPALKVKTWIKGAPVKHFQKGKIYVVEFWASWCRPCMASMPHLSDLTRKYKDNVSVLGMDIYENKTPLSRIEKFIDSVGDQMDFAVALGDSSFMEKEWLFPAGEAGIPKTFVVNREGKIAWIGHPSDLGNVLPQIVNNTWDIKAAQEKRNFNNYLANLDESSTLGLIYYTERPDSGLLKINEIVKTEPKLKYAPSVATSTFVFLLKTDPHKAYEFGKVAIVTPTYDDPIYYNVFKNIESFQDRTDLPVEIFRLGAEACQLYIDHLPFPEIIDVPKYYHKMSEMYWLAHDKPNAIAAERKAIDVFKERKKGSDTELTLFESKLREYQNKDR